MPERTQGWGKLLVQSTRQAMTLQKKKIQIQSKEQKFVQKNEMFL